MKKKLISLLCAAAMLGSSVTALAATADEYDGKSYTSLGLTQDTSLDTDGEVNLAVIANSNVYFVNNTFYVRGSVYSNGTIYGDDGGGNFVEGMLISGTGNYTYNDNGNVATFYGYKPVADASLVDEPITSWSTQIDTNGAVYDASTSTKTCSAPSWATVPDTTGYTESADQTYYYPTITVTENTHFTGETTLGADGFSVDTSNGNVNIVIDKLIISNSMPNIAVSGENTVNIYILDYVRDNSSEEFHININTNTNDSGIWSPYSSYTSVERTGTDDFDTWLNDNVYTYYDNYFYDPDKVNLYVANDTGFVDITGSKIAANMYINADSVSFSGQAITMGDVYTNAKTFTIGDNNGGAVTVNGNVCAQYADFEVVQSAMLLGQLHTNTLTMNGTGKIVYKVDAISENAGNSTVTELNTTATTAPTTAAATTAPSTSTTEPTATTVPSSVSLDIVEDVLYVVYNGSDQYVDLTINHSGPYYWYYDYGTYTTDGSTVYISGSMTDGNGDTISAYSDYYSGSHTADTAQVKVDSWASSGDDNYGQYFTLVAISTEDGSVLDSVKIVILATEAAKPAATPEPTAEPTETPTETPTEKADGTEEIYPGSSQYAYIFGDEPDMQPIIENVEGVDVTIGWYADIYMEPERSVSRQEVCAMIMRLVHQCKAEVSDSVVDDIENFSEYADWAAKGIGYLCYTGAYSDVTEDVSGYAAVSRGEVAKLVVYGLGLTKDGTPVTFTDTADSAYAEYIDIMTSNGYMQGNGDGTFSLDAEMTRAEFCQMFNCVTGRYQYTTLETENGTEVNAATYSIVDLGDADAWEVKAMLYGTSAFDDYGYVDLETREDNIRNKLDIYDSQFIY